MNHQPPITVTGKIEKQGFGAGTWALVSEEGTTYELRNLPPQGQKNCDRVTVTGQINPDIMTLAMIGPVLEVLSLSFD